MMIQKNRLMFFAPDDGGGSGGSGDAGAAGSASADGNAAAASLLAGKGTGGEGKPGDAPWNWTKEDGSFNDGWADHLPDEVKAGLPTLSKYKTLPDLMKAHVHLQSKLGIKQGAVLPPSEKSTPEELAEFRKAFGVPESPESYKILPDQLPEGWEIPKETLDAVSRIAHKHNIPEAGMRELMALQIANREQEEARIAQESVAKVESARKTLQDEWKGNYERNIKLATMAAKAVGANVESEGFADPEVVKALVRLGEQMGDDKLVNGNVAPSMQPGRARANEIMTNPKDPLYEDYHGKNGNIRQRDAAKLVADLLKNG